MIQRPSVAVGVFAEREQARAAIEDLRDAGYGETQVGLLTRAHAEEAPEEHPGSQGLTTSAATGGFIGGILGAVAALAIPGFGPAIAGGILVATLGGAAIGATAGGLMSLFTGLGTTEDEAHYYQRELEAGRTIVTVKSPTDYNQAVDLLRRNGALNTAVEHDVYTPTTLVRSLHEESNDPPSTDAPPSIGATQ